MDYDAERIIRDANIRVEKLRSLPDDGTLCRRLHRWGISHGLIPSWVCVLLAGLSMALGVRQLLD